MSAALPAFELPTELAIDTDVARRVIGEFIRGQLHQAGFERLVLGLSGGIDSALVAYLVAEAIGAERLLCVLMPYRTSSPASREDAELVVTDLGAASELVDISPMVDPLFAAEPDAAPLRRGNAMARQRMIDPVRPLGDVGWPRRRDRQQDRVAHRLHDRVRRQRLRVQPDRRPVQEPGPPGGGRDRRAGRGSSARRRRRTCGRARPTRPRPASATRSSTGCSTGASTGGGRSTRSSSWGSRARWSSAWIGWSPGPSSSARCRRSPSSAHGPRAWTTSIRADARGRPAGDAEHPGAVRRDPVRRGHAHRQPRRRDPARPRHPPRGAAHRGRGHAADAASARPARDRDAADQLPRPERPGSGGDAPWPPAWRGGPGPRVRRRHAAHQRSRAPTSSPPGSTRPGRVVPIPGPSATLAAIVGQRRGRAALGVRGIPAAIRARPAGAPRRDRRGSARDGRRTRRRAGWRRTLRDLAAACGPDRVARGRQGADQDPRAGSAGHAREPGGRRRHGRAAGPWRDRHRGRHGGVVGGRSRDRPSTPWPPRVPRSPRWWPTGSPVATRPDGSPPRRASRAASCTTRKTAS